MYTDTEVNKIELKKFKNISIEQNKLIIFYYK